MKTFKAILIFLMIFIAAIFDIAFFTNFDIYGAGIITTFLIVIIMALGEGHRDYLLAALYVVLLFSIFSSLPLIVIITNFVFLPAALRFLRSNFFPEPTVLTSALYFLASSTIFELVLLVYSKAWDQLSLLSAAIFVLLNSVFGVILFALYMKVRSYFLLNRKMKV